MPFVVARSTGHSGSRWLAELLASQNLSFFFEFAGRCPERYPLANASLKELFDVGCRCALGGAMDAVCGHTHGATCSKDALCSGRCPERDSHGCLAVGMVDTYSPGLVARLQEHRAAGEPVALVTLERDNSVKHAVSKLKVCSPVETEAGRCNRVEAVEAQRPPCNRAQAEAAPLCIRGRPPAHRLVPQAFLCTAGLVCHCPLGLVCRHAPQGEPRHEAKHAVGATVVAARRARTTCARGKCVSLLCTCHVPAMYLAMYLLCSPCELGVILVVLLAVIYLP